MDSNALLGGFGCLFIMSGLGVLFFALLAGLTGNKDKRSAPAGCFSILALLCLAWMVFFLVGTVFSFFLGGQP